MRIIVAGSRHFNDWHLLKTKLDSLTAKLQRVEIVSGHAKGADRLGERWANEVAPKRFGFKNVVLTIFHADWNEHDKAAGPIRSQEMVNHVGKAGCLVAFWDGQSKGTASIIGMARKIGMKAKVIRFGGGEDW